MAFILAARLTKKSSGNRVLRLNSHPSSDSNSICTEGETRYGATPSVQKDSRGMEELQANSIFCCSVFFWNQKTLGQDIRPHFVSNFEASMARRANKIFSRARWGDRHVIWRIFTMRYEFFFDRYFVIHHEPHDPPYEVWWPPLPTMEGVETAGTHHGGRGDRHDPPLGACW